MLHVVVMLVESLQAPIAASAATKILTAPPRRPFLPSVPMVKLLVLLRSIDHRSWEGGRFNYTPTQDSPAEGQLVDRFIEVLGSLDRSRYRPTHEGAWTELAAVRGCF